MGTAREVIAKTVRCRVSVNPIISRISSRGLWVYRLSFIVFYYIAYYAVIVLLICMYVRLQVAAELPRHAWLQGQKVFVEA